MLENHCVDVELYFFGGRYASFFSACVTPFGPYNTKHGGECESLIIGKYVFFILRVEPRTMRPDLTLPNFWTCWEGEVWYWQCRLFGKTRVFFCDSALTECCVLANKTHDNKVLLRTCPISEGCGTEPALRRRDAVPPPGSVLPSRSFQQQFLPFTTSHAALKTTQTTIYLFMVTFHGGNFQTCK